MMRAIALLSLWQLKNALRTGLTHPRKLIPGLILLAYISFQLRFAADRPGRLSPDSLPPESFQFIADHLDLISAGVFLALAGAALVVLYSGFTEGFLTFTLADVDFLFASPVSPRLVLAYRLAGRTIVSVFWAAFLYYFMAWRFIVAVSGGLATTEGAVIGLLALFFCLGGYTNLTFTLKLVFGFGRVATIRRWVGGAIGLVAVGAGYAAWQYGYPGLATAARSWLPTVLFYPCRLTADAAVAPLLGDIGDGAMLPLALFYLLTLGLLFSRQENFYEATLSGSERAARLLQAARSQNWAAIFAIHSEGRARNHRPYTIKPFGSGAGALLWANLAAAGKRPFLNCYGPLVAGVALSATALFLSPPTFAAYVAAGVSGYLLFLGSLAGTGTYIQAVRRHPLVRPLPLPDSQIVAADVLTRVGIYSLFAWGAGFTLLFSGASHADVIGLILIACVPVALTWLNAIQYMLSVWYPNPQDKLQQMLSGFVGFFMTGVSLGVMVSLLVIPLVLQAPGWLTIAIFVIPSVAIVAGLFFVAGVVYRRFEPSE